MKVFISWSGTASRAVAEALAEWLPKVIQGVEPFVSAKDIDKGANWTVELARVLEDSEFGIICLTPENLLSPWLNYEAGAIAKSVSSRACPVLHGVSKAEVNPPIAQLQMTEIEVDDFKLLMASINKAAGAPLSATALDEAVEVWWPMLTTALDKVAVAPAGPRSSDPQEPEKPEASVKEMITEVLHRMRDLDDRMRRVEHVSRTVPRRPGRVMIDEVFEALARVDIVPQSGSVTGAGIEISISEPIPDLLPGDLWQMLRDVAVRSKAEIRLVGPNRVIEFDNSGRTDEAPF